MTIEEAINKINARFDIMDYCENEELSDALDIAIKALEKQIAVKPFAKLYYNAVYCPICKETISSLAMENQNKYCHNCGNKIDWSEGYEI